MIVVDRVHPNFKGCKQVIHRFDNNYGASVITGIGSYADDSFELAVIKFVGDGDLDYELTYDTPITDDVLGYLSEDEVSTVLKQIEEL